MNNLRKLRGEKSQEYVAKKIGVSQRSYSNYETGFSQPSHETLIKLSELYNVSIDYIMGVAPKPSSSKKGIMIPVLGRVPAGVPLEAIEDIIDWEEITPDMAAMGDIFAVKVKGDSMSPMILDGDIVIIKKQSHVENGEIAIVYVNGFDATLKKIKYDNRGVYLMPFNHAYEMQYFNRDEISSMPITICGKMLELRRKYY